MEEGAILPGLGFIHRFVPAQPGEGSTLLLLHGTGGNEDDLIHTGRYLFPGAALLSPRGKVSENGMPRFFRRFSEGILDEEDIRLRAGELASFVKDAVEAYRLSPHGVIAVGYSNGANMAAALLLLHAGILAGAALFHAMVPLVPDPLPDLGGVPVFLTGGKRDVIISPAETERLSRLLESVGATVSMSWQPGGHGLSQAEIEAARDWLAESRPGAAPRTEP
jgi:predicted esterase